RMPCRTRRSSKRTVPTNSKASTSCVLYVVSIRVCPAAFICIWAAARFSRHITRRCSGLENNFMDDEFNGRVQHIERLVARVRGLEDAEARTTALELLQTVLDFHGAGLDRMMEITSAAGESGWTIIDEFGRDPLVSNLLLLHGLH